MYVDLQLRGFIDPLKKNIFNLGLSGAAVKGRFGERGGMSARSGWRLELRHGALLRIVLLAVLAVISSSVERRNSKATGASPQLSGLPRGSSTDRRSRIAGRGPLEGWTTRHGGQHSGDLRKSSLAGRIGLRLRGGEADKVDEATVGKGEDSMGDEVLSGELAEEVEKALECSTCMGLMFDPVTLPCGHSFCESCLVAWMRTGQRLCPLCRFPVPPAQQPRTSYALAQLCRRLFPKEYGRREQEVADMLLVNPKPSCASVHLVSSK